jgi:hypothetical protein
MRHIIQDHAGKEWTPTTGYLGEMNMKYCPECEAEYRDEIEICSDCSVPLITEEAYKKKEQEEEQLREELRIKEFVPVMVANNPFEAERVKAALEEGGIVVLVRTFEDTAYNGIYVAQKGWGYVEVPKTQKQAAEEIIRDLEQVFDEEAGDKELVMVCGACGKELREEATVCHHCGEPLDE